MPDPSSPGKAGGAQEKPSPLRSTYSKIAPQARDLSHQLENDEKTAGALLLQLEDVESGDPFAYLTAKSRSMYYVAKDDCRQLLAFKAEKLGEVKEADPLDTELLRFERKHERLVGLEDKAQYAQNAVLVMEERDKMMTSITRKLLDQLGVDIINFETFDISVNSTISNFLAMCNCFNSLSKVVKSMSKDESEYTTQIIGLRRQQELFQEDLQNRNAEYEQLQNQYHSLRNTIKQVSILRQQHVIETREARANRQALEIDALNMSRRSLAESESFLKDRLRLVTDELEELRRVHELSIVELRPVLERYIQHTQSDRAELQRLRSEVEISATRLALIEGKTKEAEAACATKEKEKQHALSLLKSERNLSNKLRGDLASQKRILTSAAAANVSYKKQVLALEAKLAAAEHTIAIRDGELTECRQEISGLNAKVEGLEQKASSAVLERDAAMRENRETESLFAITKVELKGVQQDLDEFLAIGYTPEKKTDHESLLRKFAIAQEEIKRVREQNRQFERRVRDLEMQAQGMAQQLAKAKEQHA